MSSADIMSSISENNIGRIVLLVLFVFVILFGCKNFLGFAPVDGLASKFAPDLKKEDWYGKVQTASNMLFNLLMFVVILDVLGFKVLNDMLQKKGINYIVSIILVFIYTFGIQSFAGFIPVNGAIAKFAPDLQDEDWYDKTQNFSNMIFNAILVLMLISYIFVNENNNKTMVSINNEK